MDLNASIEKAIGIIEEVANYSLGPDGSTLCEPIPEKDEDIASSAINDEVGEADQGDT